MSNNADHKRPVLLTVLAYAFWFVTVAGAFFLLLLIRNAALVLIQELGVHWLRARAADRIAFILMVIAFLGYAVVSEQYLQRSVTLSTLAVRFCRLLGILGLVLLGSHAVLFVSFLGSSSSSSPELLLLVGELIASAALIVVPPLIRKHHPRE